ncbi:MAG: hypothetical protein CMI79_01745 [Candidatus Pelagibacter sp.]|nr:hypothetical protein [Candidatus Pelagibacter sp.]|tara:strand:+ start:965 stop:1411 length:447 start_codon:yes stop_codon:yes gene_type:complete
MLTKAINTINSSAFLAGISMLILNIGSKYIEIGLSKTQEQAIRNSIAREILIFTIIFVGTKDIILSLFMTSAFIILADFLFNNNSKYCICRSYLNRIEMEADLNGDNKVSEEEEEKAIELLRKAKQQKKKAQQAHFASYLPKSSADNF